MSNKWENRNTTRGPLGQKVAQTTQLYVVSVDGMGDELQDEYTYQTATPQEAYQKFLQGEPPTEDTPDAFYDTNVPAGQWQAEPGVIVYGPYSV
jgi:hypothetical protein